MASYALQRHLKWRRQSRLGQQIFSLENFPEVGQEQKTERKERRKKDLTMVKTTASYVLQTPPRVTHATMGGACKPPG